MSEFAAPDPNPVAEQPTEQSVEHARIDPAVQSGPAEKYTTAEPGPENEDSVHDSGQAGPDHSEEKSSRPWVKPGTGSNGEGNDESGTPAQAMPPIPPAAHEYQIDYGRPEGVEPYVDSLFRSFAHENGVSGDMAQKMVDFNNKLESARRDEHQHQQQEWERKTRAMPGWQGRNFDRNIGVARRAMHAYASPELIELIGSSGFGNHPEVIKAFYKVGKSLSEDSYVDSNRRTPRKKTIGEILYPNQPI